MTTSRTGSAWTRNPERLSRKQIGYYRARLRNRFHQLVLKKYEASGISRAEMARRLYKRPEVITRLLGAPGNWTLDTYSDLLLSMGYEPVTAVSGIAGTAVASDASDDLAPLGAALEPPAPFPPNQVKRPGEGNSNDVVLILTRYQQPKTEKTEQRGAGILT